MRAFQIYEANSAVYVSSNGGVHVTRQEVVDTILSWKKKSKTEIKDSVQHSQHSERREGKHIITHAKAIIDGKLYDTEKSKKISYAGVGRELHITKNGNYFSCSVQYDVRTCGDSAGNKFTEHYTEFGKIRAESIESAKVLIGKYNPEKYIEIFGDVEEA